MLSNTFSLYIASWLLNHLFRAGKSTLLNHILGVKKGFDVGSDIQAVTVGAWVCKIVDLINLALFVVVVVVVHFILFSHLSFISSGLSLLFTMEVMSFCWVQKDWEDQVQNMTARLLYWLQ